MSSGHLNGSSKPVEYLMLAIPCWRTGYFKCLNFTSFQCREHHRLWSQWQNPSNVKINRCILVILLPVYSPSILSFQRKPVLWCLHLWLTQEMLLKNILMNVYGNPVSGSIANYWYGSLLPSLNAVKSLREDSEPVRMLSYRPLLIGKPSWLLLKCVPCSRWRTFLLFCQDLLQLLVAAHTALRRGAFPVSCWKTQSKKSLWSTKPWLMSHRAKGAKGDSTPHSEEGLCVCLDSPGDHQERPGSCVLSLSLRVPHFLEPSSEWEWCSAWREHCWVRPEWGWCGYSGQNQYIIWLPCESSKVWKGKKNPQFSLQPSVNTLQREHCSLHSHCAAAYEGLSVSGFVGFWRKWSIALGIPGRMN